MQTPEALLRSFEQLYLNITEPLDPFVALALTNLSLRVVETAYTMGFQDGQRGSASSCAVCGDGPCLAAKPSAS